MIFFLKHRMALIAFAIRTLFFLGGASTRATETQDWLGEDSVVLVCGAASFLGSQVSLALHRTYSPKKLILVDELLDIDGLGSLNRFESQRHRLFRVLQEIQTSNLGDQAVFYKVDLRPEVPEFLDSSIIPVLEYILKNHDDVTHVLYLPEEKTFDDKIEDNPRAIMMHALLEHLHQWENITGHTNLPQFTYTSSFEVYSGDAAASSSDVYQGRDDRPIREAPTTLKGGAYLLDEILAQTYYQNYQIDSVGLRLFTVYGPMENPGTLVSRIGEHVVRKQTTPLVLPNPASESSWDYVYIEDAVDAIMTAMQVRPPPGFGPVVINVGSGQRTSTSDLVDIVMANIPDSKLTFGKPLLTKRNKADIVAHMDRAKAVLGWEPRVSLDQGILNTIAWHLDKTFPQGKKLPPEKYQNAQNKPSWKKIAEAGLTGCDPYDVECLRGQPIYPCASECAHKELCHASFWDDAAEDSRQLSSQCKEVWYTVALNRNLADLPSVKIHVSTQSRSHLPGCSFAFVSDESPLVQRIRSGSSQENGKPLLYEFWTLIPVTLSSYADASMAVLVLVPKLTPRRFFAAGVELAVFTEPQIILDDLPALLSVARMQPHNTDVVPGVTGLLIGKTEENIPQRSSDINRFHQKTAYRMIHLKVLENLKKDRDGFGQDIVSSFLVHRLLGAGSDVAAFRCDVLNEVWSWKVSSDVDAISFTAGLHDAWSQMLAKETGKEAWWIGDHVKVFPDTSRARRRRLEEAGAAGVKAPLQYHHMLQKQIMNEEEELYDEYHRFDENGLVVHKEKRGYTTQQDPSPKDSLEAEEETISDSDVEIGDFTDQSAGKHDRWLGILSLGQTKYFVHLVDGKDMGVVDLSNLYDQIPSLAV